MKHDASPGIAAKLLQWKGEVVHRIGHRIRVDQEHGRARLAKPLTRKELGRQPNTTGSRNSAFGYYALRDNTGTYNSAFGFNALRSNTTANANSAFGRDALTLNTTGYGNSAFGKLALFRNIYGNLNSAFGDDA